MIKKINRHKSLTGFHLKLTALICMIIDHIAYVIPLEWLPYSVLRAIGRIAFPLYAFLVAEGCRHTSNRERYLLRLGLLALISEIPFDLTFNGGNISFFSVTNVFYTLFFSVASIHIYETLRRQKQPIQLLAASFCAVLILLCLFITQFSGGSAYPIMMAVFLYLAFLLLGCRYLQECEETCRGDFASNILPLLPVLPILFLSVVIGCDYDLFGVLLIQCLYIANTHRKQIVVLCAGIVYEYGFSPIFNALRYGGRIIGGGIILQLGFALVAVLLAALYNGQRGKNVKWAFYWSYPAHISVLAILQWFCLK